MVCAAKRWSDTNYVSTYLFWRLHQLHCCFDQRTPRQKRSSLKRKQKRTLQINTNIYARQVICSPWTQININVQNIYAVSTRRASYMFPNAMRAHWLVSVHWWRDSGLVRQCKPVSADPLIPFRGGHPCQWQSTSASCTWPWTGVARQHRVQNPFRKSPACRIPVLTALSRLHPNLVKVYKGYFKIKEQQNKVNLNRRKT